MSDDLRRRFEELRNEERAIVPRYFVPQRARAHLLRWAPAMLLLIVVAIALIAKRQSDRSFTPDDRAAARAIADWRSPTDFLLRTPGHEVLTSLPRIPSKGVTR